MGSAAPTQFDPLTGAVDHAANTEDLQQLRQHVDAQLEGLRMVLVSRMEASEARTLAAISELQRSRPRVSATGSEPGMQDGRCDSSRPIDLTAENIYAEFDDRIEASRAKDQARRRSEEEEDREVDFDLTANTNTPAAEDTEVEPATVEVAHEPRRSGRARQTPGGLGGMLGLVNAFLAGRGGQLPAAGRPAAQKAVKYINK